MTQREHILQLARVRCDVNYIFACMGGRVTKRSIRSVLASATAKGEISGGWREQAPKPKQVRVSAGEVECHLPAEVRGAIALEASDRSISPSELVTRILTAIFTDHLVDAVLDDRGSA